MRLSSWIAILVLVAFALLAASGTDARAADVPGAAAVPVAVVAALPSPAAPAVAAPAAPAVPGTDAESDEYARREAASPEAQEFVGGDCGFFVFVFVVAMVVVLVLYLSKEGKI